MTILMRLEKKLARQAQKSLFSIYNTNQYVKLFDVWLNQFYFTGQKYGVMKI